MTIAEFIAAHGITATATPADANPHMAADAAWHRSASHWRVELWRARPVTSLTVPFSQGAAHTAPPTAADVLECLASDAATHENARSFEEWAADLGLDSDSRAAERAFRAVERQTAKLRAWLGEDAFSALLYQVTQ